MVNPKHIQVESFDYNLPEGQIAKYPLPDRDGSKLLVYRSGNITSDCFRNIPQYLSPGHLMVFNNAKVIYARLFFQKSTGAHIEIFCLEPAEPPDYASAFRQNKIVRWKCMVGNLKKWKTDVLENTMQIGGLPVHLQARKIDRRENHVIIQFSWDNKEFTFGEILDHAGKVPIPPYLKRENGTIDKERYQTIYSRVKGSVAAPTAGLHFSDRVTAAMDKKGIMRSELTLHVGAGTFRPVKTETADQHTMHLEHFSVSRETLNRLIHHHGKIIAVGTTSVRTLESLYWLGIKMNKQKIDKDHIGLNQWEHLKLPDKIDVCDSLNVIKEYLEDTGQNHLKASTQIMITPGYRFKLTRGLITNFHLPKSTLLMLVAAFVGDDWEKIYDYALRNDFRFLSYGDSSLLLPYG
ncbi:MAG: S-adenosylmethionine:tRNA ribosyltransferase-isomerase [Bacteroidales bacterium]